MSQQKEFVLRNDGFWYAPPIGPTEELDYNIRFAHLIPDDTIDSVISVVGVDIDIYLHEIADDQTTVTVWLKDGVNKKTASVTTTILTVGGRTIVRTFMIEVQRV